MTQTEEKFDKSVKPFITSKQLYKTEELAYEAEQKAVQSVASANILYQRVVCSYIVHLAEHGDIRIIRRMLDSFPESLRKDSMQKFLDVFGQVEFRSSDEGNKSTAFFAKGKKLRLGEALEKPWFKMTKPQEYRPFILATLLDELITKAENRLTKGISEEKGDLVSHAQVTALRSAHSALIDLEPKETSIKNDDDTVEEATRVSA